MRAYAYAFIYYQFFFGGYTVLMKKNLGILYIIAKINLGILYIFLEKKFGDK